MGRSSEDPTSGEAGGARKISRPEEIGQRDSQRSISMGDRTAVEDPISRRMSKQRGPALPPGLGSRRMDRGQRHSAGSWRTTTRSTSVSSSRSIQAARPEALTAPGSATPVMVPR